MTPRIGITCSTVPMDSLARLRHVCNATYVDWVTRAGGAPMLLPNLGPELVDPLLEPLDGLLASGGSDVHPLLFGAEPHPRLGEVDVPRDRFELPLLRRALAGDLPIFGICRGIQSLNVAAGGDLRQDLPSEPEVTIQHQMKIHGGLTAHHHVELAEGTRLRGILGAPRVAVNSYHHQAVGRLGEDLRVAAVDADGTIEAIEGLGERFILGVQWHPEMMEPAEPTSLALFEAFVQAARQHAARRMGMELAAG